MNKITLLFCLSTLLISNITTSQSVATYNIVFESFWNATDHGILPPSSHWSSLVGANHNSNITFLEKDGIATQGIENIAETGNITVFRDNEVNPSITNGDTKKFINGGGLGSATGTISINGLEVSENFPLITLISMIAPSPDWMIAINSINLRNAGNTDWQDLIEIDLYAYDAGTDNGSTYNDANADVTPHIAINSLQGDPPFNNNRIGKLTITFQNTLGINSIGRVQNIKIFPNPTKGNITISNIQNTDLNSIEVYNLLGCLMKVISVKKGVSKIDLDFTSFKKGMYIVNLSDKNGVSKTQKLIIN
jgi:hypothetical protein